MHNRISQFDTKVVGALPPGLGSLTVFVPVPGWNIVLMARLDSESNVHGHGHGPLQIISSGGCISGIMTMGEQYVLGNVTQPLVEWTAIPSIFDDSDF